MRSMSSGSSMLAITFSRPAAAHALLDLDPKHALQAARPAAFTHSCADVRAR
jgi:hypothetical protein